MEFTTDPRPRATFDERASIYTCLLLCETPSARAAMEAFLADVLHHDDLPRVVRASAEVTA